MNAERLRGQTPDDLVADLRDRLDALEAANTALTNRVADLESVNAGLQVLLADVTRDNADGHDTLTFAGMNLQVVNGTGSTDGDPNGVGNLIIGYNAQRTAGFEAERTGSHYLVVGDRHAWTRFGGLLAGFHNTSTGDWASVTGGSGNIASGDRASVTGGAGNAADGTAASVSGGGGNLAIGVGASASGGNGNVASGQTASVLGGISNHGLHHERVPSRSVLTGRREKVVTWTWPSSGGSCGTALQRGPTGAGGWR